VHSAAPAPAPISAAPTLPEAQRVAGREWLDPAGTSIVGFGILRVVPPPGAVSAKFGLRYEEKPSDYSAGDEFQLFVLPGDAFAAKSSAYANEFLAFTRTHSAGYTLQTSFEVTSERTVLVAYGPWTAPDIGRPPGDRPTFRIDVSPQRGAEGRTGAFEWLESEAGELITTNWTNRPEVQRGRPYAKETMWIEVKPLILYDARFVRTPDEVDVASVAPSAGGDADAREESEDRAAAAARSDRRIVMARELAEKFRRVPIRWR
jgi:hypothetical protein